MTGVGTIHQETYLVNAFEMQIIFPGTKMFHPKLAL
jgi:hypothetical protein